MKRTRKTNTVFSKIGIFWINYENANAENEEERQRECTWHFLFKTNRSCKIFCVVTRAMNN